MLSKSRIAGIRSLHQKKFRTQQRKFIVEGPKMVSELLRSNFQPDSILATKSWLIENGQLINQLSQVEEISEKELERISGLKTPNQVLAVVHMPEESQHVKIKQSGTVLALDGISDPGNFGTIIRTADWFGISEVVCSPDCVDVFNPKVIQATMGSVFRVIVRYLDLIGYIRNSEVSVPVYGAFLDGSNIYKEHLMTNCVVVIGSESHGISDAVGRLITRRIHIPASAKGPESLNASVAAAIFCSEIVRENHKNI